MVNLFPRRYGKNRAAKAALQLMLLNNPNVIVCFANTECFQIHHYTDKKLLHIEYQWHNRKENQSEFKIL